jgi:hypothetical protein
MPNPYNRVVKTPAENRAEQVRKNKEAEFNQAVNPPQVSYFRDAAFKDKESYLVNRDLPGEHSEEGGDWLTDYTTIAPPPPID